MYSHYTPSLKNWAFCDALDRYGGRGCIFDRYGGDHRKQYSAQCCGIVVGCHVRSSGISDRYGGRGCIFDRYDGCGFVPDRYGGDCSVEYSFECYCCQHNGFRRNLCEEKTHERCQRKPVRQIYYSSD